MKKIKNNLLLKIIIAIILGLAMGYIFPNELIRVFLTFNGLFSAFLGFCIPLIIIGFVVPGIADLGNKAGKLLTITVIIAYGSTLFSGFFTYFSSEAIFPHLLSTTSLPENIAEGAEDLKPFFTLQIPAILDVMSALVFSFMFGIGISTIKSSNILKNGFNELRIVIEKVISGVIVPLLPLYIFGIFLSMSASGSAFHIIGIFGKIIGFIFVLHIILLLIQFSIAGFVTKKNPIKLLKTMMPAYFTALGTSSSAATIPVTLKQAKAAGVSDEIADFSVPLCATVHLSGSTLKIVAMALAICILKGMPHDILLFSGFIMMLGVMMIAAPGVPGGAIMAATGLLASMLGFDAETNGLMIALYIAIDSFGTACNVTGDGAIALVVDKINKKK